MSTQSEEKKGHRIITKLLTISTCYILTHLYRLRIVYCRKMSMQCEVKKGRRNFIQLVLFVYSPSNID